jgi:DNA-binding PucR family transcriptional regulator
VSVEEVNDAARTAGWPRPATVAALVVGGDGAGDEPLDADRLASLMLHGGDSSLAADLAARVLAPLTDLRPKTATRMRDTLRAWLDHPGQVQTVAERLHVHPQTVRYRVAQLRELFGDTLDDPDARFELALALRAQAD